MMNPLAERFPRRGHASCPVESSAASYHSADGWKKFFPGYRERTGIRAYVLFMAKNVPRLFPPAKAMMLKAPSSGAVLEDDREQKEIGDGDQPAQNRRPPDALLGHIACVLGDEQVDDKPCEEDQQSFVIMTDTSPGEARGIPEGREKTFRAGRAHVCRPVGFTECFSEGYGRERSRRRKGKTGGPGLHPVTCRLLTSAHAILPRLSCLYDPPGQKESQ